MSLEKKIKNDKLRIFKNIPRKVMTYALLAGLGLGVLGCWKDIPLGPISVQNTVSPAVIQSGSDGYWKVEVTNHGGSVMVERIISHEKVTEGWAVGMYDSTIDLPIINNVVSSYGKKTLVGEAVPFRNTGPNDILFENTVTIISNGGSASDTCTYTVVSPFSSSNLQSKSLEESSREVKGLADYLKN